MRLLAFTQKLSTVVDVVADDANTFEEILDDLHDNLFWCLVRCLPYAASRDDQWHEHAKNIARNIAKQRTVPTDAVLLETEFWARKAWARKGLLYQEWPDDRFLQTRCMLDCLLFGAERAIFGSLRDSVDCKWLVSACRAVQALHDLGLLGEAVARGIVELLLDWRRDERARRLFDARNSLQCDYMITLGSLLRGRMLSLGSVWATCVPVAVDAILEIGLHGCCTRASADSRTTLARASLAALGEIFEGAQHGEWKQRIEQISLLCGHVH